MAGPEVKVVSKPNASESTATSVETESKSDETSKTDAPKVDAPKVDTAAASVVEAVAAPERSLADTGSVYTDKTDVIAESVRVVPVDDEGVPQGEVIYPAIAHVANHTPMQLIEPELGVMLFPGVKTPIPVATEDAFIRLHDAITTIANSTHFDLKGLKYELESGAK